LRFRFPKDDHKRTADFYQAKYSEGFTTDCPSDDALTALLKGGFSGSQKDFKEYIAVLHAVGLKPSDSILDFGCSWGYGSWQLRNYGFKVFSYDISKQRAQYARTKLACEMVPSPECMPQRVKCLFSAHVIEHLPEPNLIWKIANNVLTDDGLIVCFCPNGEPARESVLGVSCYDQIWGKVHPMVITPRFLQSASAQHDFVPCIYSSPYMLDRLCVGEPDLETLGPELCMIAKRRDSPLSALAI
jgi:SAM-dependent methyltransferase